MRTLYVSDLDGTLLRSDESTSDYTNSIIIDLVNQGMLFSYATARSYSTACKVTKGLNAKIPLIVYNGVFVLDNQTGNKIISHYFHVDVKSMLDDFINHEIYPIVYADINSVEKFSFIEQKCTPAMKMFINSRSGDKRTNPVQSVNDLYHGQIFYISCIDDTDKLQPLYEKYKEQYHCVFQQDMYTKSQWLEIMPIAASKANAILQLKKYLKCERVIAIGDGINDIDMFELVDESYAVENAVDELKKIATSIIDTNDNDGVAKWIETQFHK